jgi:hypothetical protein
MKQLFMYLCFLAIFCACREQEPVKTKNTIEPKKTVEKQESLVKNSAFPVIDLFGIWTVDSKGPHADFELTEKSFYIVDYEGNGDIPYEIIDNKIKIFYPGEPVQTGLISKAQNDSLVIYWARGEYTTYVRWTQ